MSRQGTTAEKIALLLPRQEGPKELMALTGATRILQQSGIAFDIVPSQVDFSAYSILVLPDTRVLTDHLTHKIEEYLKQGGAVVASYQAGLATGSDSFASDEFGLTLVGEAPHCPDFIAPAPGPMAQNMADTELTMYLRGMQVLPTSAAVLAWASILSMPSLAFPEQESQYPAITLHKRVLYFCHPVFRQYAHSAPDWCRKIVLNGLNMLRSERTTTHTALL